MRNMYSLAFGPPLVFLTLNLADKLMPMLLIAGGHRIGLDCSEPAMPSRIYVTLKAVYRSRAYRLAVKERRRLTSMPLRTAVGSMRAAHTSRTAALGYGGLVARRSNPCGIRENARTSLPLLHKQRPLLPTLRTLTTRECVLESLSAGTEAAPPAPS